MICQDFTTDVKRPNPLIMGGGELSSNNEVRNLRLESISVSSGERKADQHGLPRRTYPVCLVHGSPFCLWSLRGAPVARNNRYDATDGHISIGFEITYPTIVGV
jgi:hypothetical protein